MRNEANPRERFQGPSHCRCLRWQPRGSSLLGDVLTGDFQGFSVLGRPDRPLKATRTSLTDIRADPSMNKQRLLPLPPSNAGHQPHLRIEQRLEMAVLHNMH